MPDELNTTVCPNCRGKGHVFVGWPALLVPITVWLIALAERHDPGGVTRDPCGRCGGKGFIYV